MEGVREYLLSVTAGAMVCGILNALIGEKGSLSGLFKLISGLFLCFLIISPLAKVNITELPQLAGNLLADGQQAAQEGVQSSDSMLRQIITDETRAYIMDKARTYGAELQVEITLSDTDPPVPVACTIAGALSPYVRQQLRKILITDLGIPEENHTWKQ